MTITEILSDLDNLTATHKMSEDAVIILKKTLIQLQNMAHNLIKGLELRNLNEFEEAFLDLRNSAIEMINLLNKYNPK